MSRLNCEKDSLIGQALHVQNPSSKLVTFRAKKCLNVRQKLGTRNVLMFKCSEQLLFSCVSSKVSICNYVTCRMSHVACRMSHVICQMLMLIVGTCWTIFVFMSMLKSEYLWLCHRSQVTCHMSHVRCLCWSLGHAEQFLFSSLCSKVAVYRRKLQCFFLTAGSSSSPDPLTLEFIELVPS